MLSLMIVHVPYTPLGVASVQEKSTKKKKPEKERLSWTNPVVMDKPFVIDIPFLMDIPCLMENPF